MLIVVRLVPAIKIGSDIRVHPRPMSEQIPQPFDTSIASIHGTTTHRTRHPLDLSMSTPHRSRSHGKSSSIDYTSPSGMSFHPDSASQSTPHGHIRHRVPKGSLPHIHAANFEDVRRSIIDVGQFDDAGETYDEDDGGVDLPPIPQNLAWSRQTGYTRPSESRGDKTNESIKMRRTLAEMRPAILALSTTPKSTHSNTTTNTTTHSQLNLSEFGPALLNPDLVGSISLSERSVGGEEYSRMVDEMEQVMGMDTPTRAEFVISPPASSVEDSRPGSRASLRMRSSSHSLASMPPPPVPSISNRYSGSNGDGDGDGNTTTTSSSTIALADIISTPKIPPIPLFSHPHPPPIHTHTQITHQTSLPNFSRPHHPTSAHPPVPILHPLKKKHSSSSSSTIHSDYTQSEYTHKTSSSGDSDSGFTIPIPMEAFQPSKQELARVEQLRLRAQAVAVGVEMGKGRSKSAMGVRDEVKDKEKEGAAGKKGLKPLQLVEAKKANRLSAPLPTAPVGKRVSVLQEGGGGANGVGSKGSSNKGEKRVKGSAGDKENARPSGGKTSKASTGSGGHVIRV
jgi:hypothetical protein